MDPSSPPLAFWKLFNPDVISATSEVARSIQESRWAEIVRGLALSLDVSDGAASPGEALAKAGYSELRLQRLLRAGGDALSSELESAARFLATKAESFEWTDLALLVLSPDGDPGEQARRRIARTYFSQLNKQQNSKES